MADSASYLRQVDKVYSTQKYTASEARAIARASRGAARDLARIEYSILSNWTELGAFSSMSEARAFLDSYCDEAALAALREAAMLLPEGAERTAMLNRLSAPAYRYRLTRAQAVNLAQQAVSASLRGELTAITEPALERAYLESTRRTLSDLEVRLGAGIRMDMPNKAAIDEVLRGSGVYDRVVLFSDEEMVGVRDVITRGMLSGKSPELVAKEVSDLTGKEMYKARRLARTTTAQASVDATTRTCQDLGFSEYRILCTNDERLCPVCGAMEGRVFRFDDPEAPRPTFHPNCRCDIAATGDWRLKLREEGAVVPEPRFSRVQARADPFFIEIWAVKRPP